jgi:DNA-binding PadR family transcriptional regulator
VGIRESLLALLSTGPAHGYQLKQAFEERTGRAWLLNVGQVYTTLQRLERDGVVEGLDGEGEARRRYRITPAGRDEVRRWFLTPVPRVDPQRDELSMKVLMALGNDELRMEDILQAQRTATVEGLQQLTRTKANADPDADLAWLLVVDSMIMHAEAEIRWLDLCEARLRRARPLPAVLPADEPSTMREVSR